MEENSLEEQKALRKKLKYLKKIKADLLDTENGITDYDRKIREECELSLLAFAQHAWHLLEPGSRKMLVGWALEGMALHLEAIESGDLTRLLINIPPGAMKSLLTRVFFPAWVWGPKKKSWMRFLYASYDQKLSIRDAKKMRELVTSDWYRRLWPDVEMTSYQAEKANFQNTDNGFVMSLSVGGRTTGERGDIVIIDDPHNVTEAESELVRTSTVDWFKEAIPMRLNDFDASAIIVIMQRVHEDDVSGHILSSESLDYEHFCVPLYYEKDRHCQTRIGWEDPRQEEGENFWPERYTEKFLSELTKDMGPYAVAAQLQQIPSPRGGGYIKREWWQLWKDEWFPPFEYILASVDTAYSEKTEGDYSALTIWGLFRDQFDLPKIMLVSAWRDHLNVHELVKKIAETCKKFKADKLLVEGKASGISVSQEIRRMFRDDNWGVQLINPKGDKIARVLSVEPLFAEGIIYAPDKKWADMVIDEVSKFPRSKHDDLVDSMSMALRFMRDNGLALRRIERDVDLARRMEFTGRKEAIYDI